MAGEAKDVFTPRTRFGVPAQHHVESLTEHALEIVHPAIVPAKLVLQRRQLEVRSR